MSDSTVRSLEAGRRSPKLETVEEVAAALGLRLSDLFARAEQIAHLDQTGLEHARYRAAIRTWHQTGDDSDLHQIAEDLGDD